VERLLVPDSIISDHDTKRRSTVGLRRSLCRCTLRCTPYLISPVAWLPPPSGMFYRALSLKRGRSGAYNEKDHGYVAVSKKMKRRRVPSRRSSGIPQPDKRDHNTAVKCGPSHLGETRSVAEIGGKTVVKRTPVPRVLKGADLYVVRRTKTGFGCAQPCWRW